MRHYAMMTKGFRLYTQGFLPGKFGVWIGIDGTQTLIGYGSPDEAMAEAEQAMAQALEKLRAEIARIKSGTAR